MMNQNNHPYQIWRRCLVRSTLSVNLRRTMAWVLIRIFELRWNCSKNNHAAENNLKIDFYYHVVTLSFPPWQANLIFTKESKWANMICDYWLLTPFSTHGFSQRNRETDGEEEERETEKKEKKENTLYLIQTSHKFQWQVVQHSYKTNRLIASGGAQ